MLNRHEVLRRIKQTVESKYAVSELILFGSQARSDTHELSDWDVLIIVEDALTEKDKILLHKRLCEVELETGELINAIIHTTQEWRQPRIQATPFYQNVVREGVRV